MPIRGETIGTAYVKILADGSGFGRSVRDMVHDSEGDYRQAGRTHSEAYQEGFEEQTDRFGPAFIRGLVAGIRRNSGRLDATADQITSDLFDPLDKEFEERFGEIGKQMSVDIREGFRKSGGDDQFLDEFVENLEANFEKARRTIEAANKKLQLESAQSARQVTAEFKELSRQIDEYHRSLNGSFSARRKFLSDLEELDGKMRNLGETTKTYNREHSRLYYNLKRTHPLLQKSSHLFDVFGDSIGRAFGKGSRNNFFNIFGRVTGFLVSLPGLIPKAAQKLLDFGFSVQKTFTDAGGGFSGFAALAAKGAITITALATALGVLSGILVIVGALVGIVSSALLSLVGAAVALASTLAFALGGAIGVVAGALIPLAAAVGTAFLAFKGLSTENIKALNSIKKSFKELGKEAAKNIFDSPKKDLEAFKGAVKSLGRITGPVSKALGGLLDDFVESLKSPEVGKFEDFLGRVLPGMVTSLGHIFGNLGLAILGLFKGVAPATADFLNWLEDVTARFADWANSGKGQNSIKDFMDKAAESAKQVGGLMLAIIDLFAQLFSLGKNEGDNLFQSLTDTIQHWADLLKDPENRKMLRQWFKDAGDTATKIGDMVVALSVFIAELDTPKNRKLVRDIADAFVAVIGAIDRVIAVVTILFDLITGGGKTAEKAIGKIQEAWHGLAGGMRNIYNAVIGPVLAFLIRGVGDVIEGFADLFDLLGHIPGFGWAKDLAADLHRAAAQADAVAAAVENIPTHKTVLITVVTQHQGGSWETPDTGPGPGSGPPRTSTGTSRTLSTTGTGKTVNMVVNMTTPTADPATVASELMNRLATAAYV